MQGTQGSVSQGQQQAESRESQQQGAEQQQQLELMDRLRNVAERSGLGLVAIMITYHPTAVFRSFMGTLDNTQDQTMEAALGHLGYFCNRDPNRRDIANATKAQRHNRLEKIDTQHLSISTAMSQIIADANRQGHEVFMNISDVSNGERRILSLISQLNENQRNQVNGRVSDSHARLDMFWELSNYWHNSTQSAAPR